MKSEVICEAYDICDSNGCRHKFEHKESYNCFCNYASDELTFCVDVIKLVRKKKLEKLNQWK